MSICCKIIPWYALLKLQVMNFSKRQTTMWTDKQTNLEPEISWPKYLSTLFSFRILSIKRISESSNNSISDNCQHLPQFEFGNVLVHNSLINDQNVWMSMISPLKRFLAAVAADLGQTTRDIQVLNLEMVRLFLIDWAL